MSSGCRCRVTTLDTVQLRQWTSALGRQLAYVHVLTWCPVFVFHPQSTLLYSYIHNRIFSGMGCFWGAEKRFWNTKGVFSTQVCLVFLCAFVWLLSAPTIPLFSDCEFWITSESRWCHNHRRFLGGLRIWHHAKCHIPGGVFWWNRSQWSCACDLWP